MTTTAKIVDAQNHLAPVNNNDTVDFNAYRIGCLFDVNHHSEASFPLPFATTAAFSHLVC